MVTFTIQSFTRNGSASYAADAPDIPAAVDMIAAELGVIAATDRSAHVHIAAEANTTVVVSVPLTSIGNARRLFGVSA